EPARGAARQLLRRAPGLGKAPGRRRGRVAGPGTVGARGLRLGAAPGPRRWPRCRGRTPAADPPRPREGARVRTRAVEDRPRPRAGLRGVGGAGRARDPRLLREPWDRDPRDLRPERVYGARDVLAAGPLPPRPGRTAR